MCVDDRSGQMASSIGLLALFNRHALQDAGNTGTHLEAVIPVHCPLRPSLCFNQRG